MAGWALCSLDDNNPETTTMVNDVYSLTHSSNWNPLILVLSKSSG